MRLLLDTHALLWWLADDPTLSGAARVAIADAANAVYVSAATAWEISIKRAIGKLESPADLAAQIRRHQFDPLPISLRHAMDAGALPHHHADPFDRMLVAQAMAERLTIATRDQRIPLYGVAILAA
jgi:PIN domain nuclease of toxin-antitoxin system